MLSDKQLAYAAADAWAGRAVFERVASLDDAAFGYEACRKLLESDERGCAQLYALRRARQATKAAMAGAIASLEEDGLPNHRGDAEEGRLLARRASRRLKEARSVVLSSLKDDRAMRLPVGRALDDAGLPG